MKDQPLSADASHTALSPSYIANFNLEEDEEDPEEDPADYPANEGDNSDDESSDDDKDDDDVEKDEEDREEGDTGTGNANAVNNQRVTVASQKAICYECGNQGHYKRNCPERKNQSHKNQIGGTRVYGVVHTLRGGETNQNPNSIKDEIEA
ncbi:hypothetical protein Tco_0655356 [Tanacetum coccineum]|uniref:CCHC-type domain-containing protein n=1 Tax=Tanacetum coccineum TaxID=301880 RepID=A0ABQ4X5T2_9ASTR